MQGASLDFILCFSYNFVDICKPLAVYKASGKRYVSTFKSICYFSAFSFSFLELRVLAGVFTNHFSSIPASTLYNLECQIFVL